MRAQANRLEDKRYLYALSDSLETSYERVHLDECGDWNIFGKKGKLFTDTKQWYLYISPENSRIWNNIKKKLKFMKVSQDGDGEGILKLERMPTAPEAEAIRKVLQIRKRTILSEEDRALLKIRFKSSCSKGVSGPYIDLNQKDEAK